MIASLLIVALTQARQDFTETDTATAQSFLFNLGAFMPTVRIASATVAFTRFFALLRFAHDVAFLISSLPFFVQMAPK